MKLLILVLTLGLVSCNSSDIQEAIEANSQKAANIDYEITSGEYLSSQCEEDNRGGYKSHKIRVTNNWVTLTTMYHHTECEDVGYDRTYSYYDIVSADLEYIRTDYTDMIDDGQQACGLSGLELGLSYDIDGVDCELSYENIKLKLVKIDDKNINIMGKIFTRGLRL